MLHTRLPGVDMNPQAANDAKNESYSGAKSPRLQNDSPAPGFGTPEYYSALVASYILSSRSAPTTAAKHKQLINSLVPLIEMSEMHILLELEHLLNEALEKHTISQSQLSRVRSLVEALRESKSNQRRIRDLEMYLTSHHSTIYNREICSTERD